ncbi:radical SAM family heme chaperone HemW [Rhodohalobacter sulfatireducens]|uniref:Heme chaperone HemW n=1 Tax=Rhodohalobacter sulfatireducens TaxID=2911366 RepID=A0ABS9K803_9BACT|nr:radical SAM family heme chaperone HemW [Rhodohalobacter sulfatireducens]MCG2586927.1 radical SAM family heme chaperone HemW [Rhodohalobacter sulfatireducens]
MSGIYIHIPFCKQACSYCDFYFLTRDKLRQPFVEALLSEINSYGDTKFSKEIVRTIYLGGGTPSLLNNKQLESIFGALHSVFDIDAEEITMELNPDDVTRDYLSMIQDLGVNRASMGVQSFDKKLLEFMHRAHNPEEAFSALEALQKTGFPTFTADLIYGNPGQSVETLEQDIDKLLSFDPPHISAYSLTVEPKTRLGKQVELGRIDPPDDDRVSEQFDVVRTQLAAAGIEQYEVSNFSKPGKEAVHNSNYWKHENYIGFGPSAHSFWWDESGANRWQNEANLKKYLNEAPEDYREEEETLSKNTLAEERLMLGLRTKWGVSEIDLKQSYGYSFTDSQWQWIEDQVEKGFMVTENSTLKMTSDGLKISDHLIVELLS